MRTALWIAAAFIGGIATAIVGRWVRSKWTIVRREPAVGEAAAKK